MGLLNRKLSLDEFLDLIDELDKEESEVSKTSGGGKGVGNSKENPPSVEKNDPEKSSGYIAVRLRG